MLPVRAMLGGRFDRPALAGLSTERGVIGSFNVTEPRRPPPGVIGSFNVIEPRLPPETSEGAIERECVREAMDFLPIGDGGSEPANEVCRAADASEYPVSLPVSAPDKLVDPFSPMGSSALPGDEAEERRLRTTRLSSPAPSDCSASSSAAGAGAASEVAARFGVVGSSSGKNVGRLRLRSSLRPSMDRRATLLCA